MDDSVDLRPFRIHNDAKRVEDLLQGYAVRHLLGLRGQLKGRNLLEALDQRKQSLEVLVAYKILFRSKVCGEQRDGAAHITHLVGDCSRRYPVIGQKLAQRGLFAVAHLFGGVYDDCGKTSAFAPGVRRKPGIGKEQFTAAAASLALR